MCKHICYNWRLQRVISNNSISNYIEVFWYEYLSSAKRLLELHKQSENVI